MLIDKSFELADSVSIASAAGTYVLGTVDLGAADSKPNSGRNLFAYITIEQALASGGAATVQFRLVTDTVTPVVAANATPLWTSATFGFAELTAGKRLVVPLTGGYPLYKRYLGLVCIIGVAALTAGKVNAGLELSGENWDALPDGI